MFRLNALTLPVAGFLLAAGLGSVATTEFLERPVSKERLAYHLVPQVVEMTLHSKDTSVSKAISVGRFEVTIAQYEACVLDGGCRHRPKQRAYKDSSHPVTDVSWMDATQYVEWLSDKTDVRYRLPLNSEWQAFAGELAKPKPTKMFDDPRMAWAADYANYGLRPPKNTKPVSGYKANQAGIHGIAGNVWEWTNTCWRKQDAAGFDADEAEGCGGVRLLQGLHKTNQSEFIRTVKPGGCSIGFAPVNIGFRVVREAPQMLAQE